MISMKPRKDFMEDVIALQTGTKSVYADTLCACLQGNYILHEIQARFHWYHDERIHTILLYDPLDFHLDILIYLNGWVWKC
jgi:hypothetical protein